MKRARKLPRRSISAPLWCAPARAPSTRAVLLAALATGDYEDVAPELKYIQWPVCIIPGYGARSTAAGVRGLCTAPLILGRGAGAPHQAAGGGQARRRSRARRRGEAGRAPRPR